MPHLAAGGIMLGRWWFAMWTVLAPALALAQSASDNGTPTRAGFSWLWIIAAIAVLVALFSMFFGRPRDRPTPPARTP